MAESNSISIPAKTIIQPTDGAPERSASPNPTLARLEQSRSYRLIRFIRTLMDDWYLDPIIGFFPGIGDWITAPLMLPYLYVSAVKMRSLPLTFAVLYNWLLDACIGLVPVIGDIADFFSRSYRRSYRMIVAYAEGDSRVVSEVRRKAFRTALLIFLLLALFVALLMLLTRFTVGLYSLIASLFAS